MSLNNSKHGPKKQKNQCEIKELLYIKSIFLYKFKKGKHTNKNHHI
jgi:hypothetical protein